MKKHLLYLLFFIGFFLSNAQKNNVILIIADDLGTDYCSFYENNIDVALTPNIQRLLKQGVRFTNAWSNPVCSPTRAGILTGRYSFRTGVRSPVGGLNSVEIDTSETTLPQLLNNYKSNGISKANIGKWHLSSPNSVSKYSIPNKMGFNHYEGSFSGTLEDYNNWTKITNGTASTITNYATTENVNNAINWISNQDKNKPFFLWLAFNAPHLPFHLPPSKLHTNTTLDGSETDIKANPKEYFKVMIEALDHEMGRLFDYLETTNRWNTTEIIFIGDNGDANQVTQGTGGAKGTVYQEGVSVPFIISGPSVVQPNRASNALVNTHDLFATILELFGNKNWKSEILPDKPVDSKSIMPIILNKSNEIRPWIFTEIFKTPSTLRDAKAIRNLEYKLIRFDNGNESFFNLISDSNEDHNLLQNNLSTIEKKNYDYLLYEMNKLINSNK
jgi:arylsulfatase A-like enzyme